MAYFEKLKRAYIVCDKCQYEESAEIKLGDTEHGKVFFDSGWTANFKAKKYVHICYKCQTKKQKSTTDWIRNKFK